MNLKSIVLLCAFLTFVMPLHLTTVYLLDHELVQTPALQEMWTKAQLRRHNYYRSIHGCPPLVIDANITKQASEYADLLFFKNSALGNQQFILPPQRNFTYYGLNTYFIISQPDLNYTPGRVSDAWYAQQKNFDYTTSKAKGTFRVDLFTQMIWRSASRVGFGFASGKISGTKRYALYIAAYYNDKADLNNIPSVKFNVPKP